MRDGHITEDLNEQLFTNEPSNKEFQISDCLVHSLSSLLYSYHGYEHWWKVWRMAVVEVDWTQESKLFNKRQTLDGIQLKQAMGRDSAGQENNFHGSL